MWALLSVPTGYLSAPSTSSLRHLVGYQGLLVAFKKNGVDIRMKPGSREQWKPEPGEWISLEDRDTQGYMELPARVWVCLEWVTEI